MTWASGTTSLKLSDKPPDSILRLNKFEFGSALNEVSLSVPFA